MSMKVTASGLILIVFVLTSTSGRSSDIFGQPKQHPRRPATGRPFRGILHENESFNRQRAQLEESHLIHRRNDDTLTLNEKTISGNSNDNLTQVLLGNGVLQSIPYPLFGIGAAIVIGVIWVFIGKYILDSFFSGKLLGGDKDKDKYSSNYYRRTFPFNRQPYDYFQNDETNSIANFVLNAIGLY